MKKKNNNYFLLLILILGLSIGFAALSTTLKINGTTIINKNTWNVYWDNIDNQTGVTPTSISIDDEDENNLNNIVNFSVTLDKPGDFYEFTVDAVNAGTIDAEILTIQKKYNDTIIPSVIDNEHPSPVPSYIKYIVTYEDGTEIVDGDRLNAASGNTPTRKTFKVRVEYDRDAVTKTDINSQQGTVSHLFSFSVQFGQAAPTFDYECPGVHCLYAINQWYYDGIPLTIGDVIPMNIGTSISSATENYNSGPVRNYNKLLFEFKTYRNSTYDAIYKEKEECEVLTGDECEYYDIASFNAKFFKGYIVNYERIIQREYLCIVDDNSPSSEKVYCARIVSDTESEYENIRQDNIEKAYAFFGEYNSNNNTGCEVTTDKFNKQNLDCKTHDKNGSILIPINNNNSISGSYVHHISNIDIDWSYSFDSGVFVGGNW